LDEGLPLRWDIRLVEDGRNGADRSAGITVSADGRINEHLRLSRPPLNAINGTNVDAEQLFRTDTRLTNYESQAYSKEASFVMVGVDLDEVPPLLWEVVLGEDCLNRTCWLTRATVDAFVGVNVKELSRFEVRLVLSRVNAIYWANIDAGSVFRPYTGFGDHVSHLKPKPPYRGVGSYVP
jgi:hypothetical protein